MPATFEAEDHVLRWPRELFRRRLAELINARQQSTAGWGEEVELFLDDAFASNQPVDTFRSTVDSAAIDPWGATEPATQTQMSPRRRYLIDLLQAADSFPHELRRRPYRSQRGRPDGAATTISLSATAARFVNLIIDLDERGYFERAFQKDCVDDARSIDPSVLIEEEIGVPDLWPLSVDRLTNDVDVFMDVI